MSKTYKHIGYDDILNISSRSGSPVDRMGNALTPANLNFEQDGDVLAARFNGADSDIDCGAVTTFGNNKTFIVWAKPYSLGESNNGRIIDSGNDYIAIFTGNRIEIRTAAVNYKYSAVNSISINKWNNISITLTALGVINIYVNSVLSGGADQAGLTPTGSNIIIGNNNVGSRAFDGLIEAVRIKNRILTVAEISQIYTSERAKYENH